MGLISEEVHSGREEEAVRGESGDGLCCLREEFRWLFTMENLKRSGRVFPFWFLANGLYNYSLASTSVTSNTIISAMSGSFTLLLSVCLKIEAFSWWKLAGVALSLLGAVLVALSDSSGKESNCIPADAVNRTIVAAGDAPAATETFGEICSHSALHFYAVYTIAIMKNMEDDGFWDAAKLFGFIGLLGLLIFGPITAILHLSGLEGGTLTVGPLLLMVVKGLFDNVLSDAIWAKSMRLTTPTVATLGLALTIPASIVADAIFCENQPTFTIISGAAAMVSGFVCVVTSSSKRDDGIERGSSANEALH